MVKNSVIRAEFCGAFKTLYRRFDDDKQKTFLDWDYKGLNNPNIYFTEDEAIALAKSYKGISHIKNIQVIQPLHNGDWYILDYINDEIKYHLKKAPTS